MGCSLTGAAAWRCASRDRWIGWSDAERCAGLWLVANQQRFLILNAVRVPHLASHVLSLVSRRLSGDYEARYGHPVHLLESFVDSSRFSGTCYRAAGWHDAGQTTGRSRNGRPGLSVPRKRVFFFAAVAAGCRGAPASGRLGVLSAALQRRLDAALAEQAELNRQLDLASGEIRRLSEHRSHCMQQTEREQEARRREAHGRSRLEAEAEQLRRELAKARRCAAALQEQLQALQSKFEKAVLAARRYAAMAFGSLSERLGSEAGKAALEADPECPDWLWDDRFLAPSGEAAEGADGEDADGDAADGDAAEGADGEDADGDAADGDAAEGADGEDADGDAADGDAAPAQPRIRRPRKLGRPTGARGGRKIGDEVPTITCRLEPDETVCPCCGGERKIIRTEAAQRLHYVPANYVRIAIERPVLGCARCRQKAPAQAPAPDWLILRGLPTEAMLAHAMASKFQDHLPTYRLAQRLARHGIRIGTATLNGWLRQGFRILEPGWEAIRTHVFAATRLFLDETTVRFLEPGYGPAVAKEIREFPGYPAPSDPGAWTRGPHSPLQL